LAVLGAVDLSAQLVEMDIRCAGTLSLSPSLLTASQKFL
jgi:hypothetical protein